MVVILFESVGEAPAIRYDEPISARSIRLILDHWCISHASIYRSN